MKLVLFLLIFIAANVGSNSVKKFEALQKSGVPFLETYWESYASFPYGEGTCGISNLEPGYVDETAYGYDIKQVPDHINIINIAFAHATDTRYVFIFFIPK